MKELSKKVFDSYQVRKTKKQKEAFINLLQKEFKNKKIQVEEGGFLKSRNIIVGDLESSKIVLGAHYDTQPVLPFPNFLTPKNFPIYLLFNFILIGVFLLIELIIEFLVIYFTDSIEIGMVVGILACVFLIGWLFIGKANQHTANDNTSGVITLLEACLDEELSDQVCCVFFDHEEVGLIGSSVFYKKHKDILNKKLFFNFDCVGEGDTIMMILSKSAMSQREKIQNSFQPEGHKTFLITKSTNTLYPSDQMNFKRYVGVAAFKKNKILGYYMDKIHTKHDTHLDEMNIKMIIKGLKEYIK